MSKYDRKLKRWSPGDIAVFSEMIDVKVCAGCADEDRKLGINVEPLDSGEGKKRRQAFS